MLEIASITSLLELGASTSEKAACRRILFTPVVLVFDTVQFSLPLNVLTACVTVSTPVVTSRLPPYTVPASVCHEMP